MKNNEKGILTKEMESKIAAWIDNKIKLDGMMEGLDGILFKVLVSLIDNNFGEKIPEPYKSEMKKAITSIFEEKNYEKAISEAIIFLDTLVDIPFMDDESETLLFQGLITIIVTIVAQLNTHKEVN